MPKSFIGQSILRVEDPRFLLGQGQYVADITLPGMLHAAFLPSPHAHAVIEQIDTGRARQLRGVHGVFTGQELEARLAQPILVPGQDSQRDRLHVPVMAVDRVRFMGEPVAVVVAEDRYLAEDALDAIQVSYSTLPPVLDAEQAMTREAPLLEPERGSNVVAHYQHARGDIEAALEVADLVLRLTYRQQRQSHAPMETCGCIADWHAGRQQLDVYTTTQHAYVLRDLLAPILGLPLHRLRVVTPDVGGSFGQKGVLHREEVAVSVLARLLKRPVKWIEDRRSNLTASAQAREGVCHVQVAVQKDGTLLGIKAQHVTDLGAYLCLPTPTSIFAMLTAGEVAGPWRFSHFAYDAYAVRTNKCPIAAYRAPGLAGFVVSENLMEVIAQELRLDPAEVRRKNILRQSDLPYRSPSGSLIQDVAVDQTLERALVRIGYAEFRQRQAKLRAVGRYLGLGLGSYIGVGAVPTPEHRLSGAQHVGWSSTTIQVEATGDVTVRLGTSPHGQGHETTMAQLVAQELGVELAAIRVTYGDTARDSYGGGTSASQSMVIGGGATQRAAQAIRTKILGLASQILQVPQQDLELRGGGRIGVRGRLDLATSLAAVANHAYYEVDCLPAGESPGLVVTASYEPPHFGFQSGTHACIAEVDPQTGRVAIERLVVVADCGRIINPLIVTGQIIGAVTQALGGVLYEHAQYDAQGRFLTDSLLSYQIPFATDIPPIDVEFLEWPSPTLPYGAKPAGECGVLGAAPAILNAIADALAPFGVRISDQPLTPSRILQLLKQQGHVP